MNIKPTDTELEILQILWDKGPSTVKFVNEIQNKNKQVGYTTTLKIMQIMAEKEMLKVDKKQRQHIYAATMDKEETQRGLLDSFLDKTFKGSASKLVMQLLGNKTTSASELEEIKNYLNELEKNKKEK
jgi:predicted transcriptional regulator